MEHAPVTADNLLGGLSLSFDGYAFGWKRIGCFYVDGSSPTRAEIHVAAQIYSMLGIML